MTLRLTRLDANLPITADGLGPSQQFMRWQQKDKESIEAAFADLISQLAAIAAAQASATGAARELARINSYPSPSAILDAADAGADATISIAAHSRIYPVQGSIDVPDVVIPAIGTVTGLAFSTLYYVYYDDTTLIVTAPTYLATTTAATAQVGAAAGRHFVGSVTTPANGAPDTSGGGYQAPGGVQP